MLSSRPLRTTISPSSKAVGSVTTAVTAVAISTTTTPKIVPIDPQMSGTCKF